MLNRPNNLVDNRVLMVDSNNYEMIGGRGGAIRAEFVFRKKNTKHQEKKAKQT